jgi:hypothetical protein
MQFYTVRDLRTQPRKVWEKLARYGEVVITNNGKPSALMIEVDDENVEEVLASARQSMAMRVVNKLRTDSDLKGTSRITSEEIQAEIEAARRERKGD